MLSNLLCSSEQIDYSELQEYVDARYGELQDQIMDTDLDKYEDQLNVVAWKGQQEELVELLRHFDADKEGKSDR